MPTLAHVSQAATVGTRVAVGQPNPMTIPVDPVLGRALAACGFDTCEGGPKGDKLSDRQVAKLMEGCADIHQRIELKLLIAKAGLLLPAGR